MAKPRSSKYVETPLDTLREIVSRGRRSGKRNGPAEYALRMRVGRGSTTTERRGHGSWTKSPEKTPKRSRPGSTAQQIFSRDRAALIRAKRHRRKHGGALHYLEYDFTDLSPREVQRQYANARRTLGQWLRRYRAVSFYIVWRGRLYIHPQGLGGEDEDFFQGKLRERFTGWILARDVDDLDYHTVQVTDDLDGQLLKIYLGVFKE